MGSHSPGSILPGVCGRWLGSSAKGDSSCQAASGFGNPSLPLLFQAEDGLHSLFSQASVTPQELVALPTPVVSNPCMKLSSVTPAEGAICFMSGLWLTPSEPAVVQRRQVHCQGPCGSRGVELGSACGTPWLPHMEVALSTAL